LGMSSSLILSWWYPDLTSILEKTHAPWSNKSLICGKGYLFLMMILFNYL